MKKSKTFNQESYLKKLQKEDPAMYKVLLNHGKTIENSEGSVDSDKSLSEDEDLSSATKEFEDYDEEESELEDEEEENELEDEEEENELEYEEDKDELYNEPKLKKRKLESSIMPLKKEIMNIKTFPKAFRKIEEQLRSALSGIQNSQENDDSNLIADPRQFNEIIKFCLTHVSPGLYKYYKIKSHEDKPVKSKKAAALNPTIRYYLKDFIVLLRSMVDSSAAEVILSKGILPLIPFYISTPKLSILLVKHLSNLWSSTEENVRILAFVAVFRLCRVMKDDVLEQIFKLMHTAYLSNCRFTSPMTLAMIDFMRTSLVELFCQNHAVAYKLCFLFIRNMAFHIRNAITVPKKEKIQIVYNWMFVHNIHFLAELLSKSCPSPVLEPLNYPLIQICLGSMNLQKSPRYFPLVIHICNILTDFSRHADVFIPVLPFLLEILQYKRLKARNQKPSNEPLNWFCILKLSLSELEGSAFAEGMMDQLFGSILNYLSVESSSIGFPELVFPTILQIKSFLKTSKCPGHTKKMKQLLDKIKENSDCILNKRKDVTFGVSDTKAVKDWEISVKQSNPPIDVFFESWKKMKEKQPNRSMAPKDDDRVKDLSRFAQYKKRQQREMGRMNYEEDGEEDQNLSKEDPDSDSNSDVLGQYAPFDDENDSEDDADGHPSSEDEEEVPVNPKRQNKMKKGKRKFRVQRGSPSKMRKIHKRGKGN